VGGDFFDVGGGDVGGFVGKELELVHEVAAEHPLGEAAAAPVGDVLLVNGVAFEGGFEYFLDFGEGVEPFGDGGGGAGAFEAFVYFLAQGGRELGYF